MKYGKIRSTKDIEVPFDSDHYTTQYSLLCNFILGHIQKVMLEEYNLIQVLFPEKRYHEDVQHQCNIFMSREFYQPDRFKNQNHTALILI